jgi:uncharacterized protein (TIGR02647 family)
MSLTPELVAELEVLALFNLDSSQEGLKIHQTAAPKHIAAAQRLFEKELIDQPDGGYLTSLGRDAAQNVQTLLTILKASRKQPEFHCLAHGNPCHGISAGQLGHRPMSLANDRKLTSKKQNQLKSPGAEALNCPSFREPSTSEPCEPV